MAKGITKFSSCYALMNSIGERSEKLFIHIWTAFKEGIHVKYS